MARQWQRISLEDAKRHPLYGIKNWLAVFAFGVLISPLRSIGELSNAAHEAGLALPQLLNGNTQFGDFIQASLAFELTIAALLLWLLFSKHRNFRIATIALLLLHGPGYLMVAYITDGTKVPGFAAEFTQKFLSSFLLIALWVIYLHRSRRVRVTFENCIVVEKTGSSAAQRNSKPSASTPTTTAGNDAYAGALAEIEEHRLDKGTWARSFAESGGDESKAKALYITARVAAIGSEAVWVNTQTPVSGKESQPQSQSNSDVPSGGYEPGQASRNTGSGSKNGVLKNLVWSDAVVIIMVVVGLVGYVLYEGTTKQQAVAATQTQAVVPQVNWSQYEAVQSPAQTEGVVNEAPKATEWDSYVQKVRGLEAAVNRRELPQVDGVVSFGQPTYLTQWPSAYATALESGQTWWRNGVGNDFHIHVKNSTSNSLTVLGLEYSESGCESNGERSRFFVTLPKPLAAGAESVIHFKPELTESKQKNNCLVIFSAS